MKKPDSIIFDMDGTLWDALDTYVESWNSGFKQLSIDKQVSRQDISHMMGWEGRKVLAEILPEYDIKTQDEIYSRINVIRKELVKETGGRLYEGVVEGLKLLSARYQLFIVSNCPKGLIKTFTRWANIQNFITDEMEYGMNMLPKSENIKILVERYHLQNPIYVGDTDGDRKESELAKVPFVFLSFGFGTATRYELKFDNFIDFTQYFLSLK